MREMEALVLVWRYSLRLPIRTSAGATGKRWTARVEDEEMDG